MKRHAVGIELNPAYVAMAKKRLEREAPLFHLDAQHRTAEEAGEADAD